MYNTIPTANKVMLTLPVYGISGNTACSADCERTLAALSSRSGSIGDGACSGFPVSDAHSTC